MFYHLLYPLSESVSFFNVFRYITYRSFLAFMIAVIFSIAFGKWFIEFMRSRQFGQVVRNDGPTEHLKKVGTPTMGGIFILSAVSIAVFLCGNFHSMPVLITLFVVVSTGLLGWLDDYLKVIKKNTDGVAGKVKLLWQTITGLIAGYLLVKFNVVSTELYLPFAKGPVIDLGIAYIPFVALVITASSNAVNLTDGLDGLAIGPVITSALSLGFFAYVCGHKEISSYLFIPHIEGVGEMTVLASAIIGAGVGFLWFNSYPAQMFMGDVGSLSLGGFLGILSILTKNEILFVFIGGIFVMEAVSVILQVGSYKLRKKRIFKMAPIHHHFELKGWPEPKVIVRFWIISLFLAILSISTIKMR